MNDSLPPPLFHLFGMPIRPVPLRWFPYAFLAAGLFGAIFMGLNLLTGVDADPTMPVIAAFLGAVLVEVGISPIRYPLRATIVLMAVAVLLYVPFAAFQG